VEFSLVSPEKPIIIIKAQVNGQGPFDFAVDTGASTTVLSRETAEKLGISESPSTPKKGHGCCGEVDMALTKVDSVQVGDNVVKDIEVAFGDLTAISKALGVNLGGILGYSFMKNYKVIIDYPNKRLFFEKP